MARFGIRPGHAHGVSGELQKLSQPSLAMADESIEVDSVDLGCRIRVVANNEEDAGVCVR